MLLKERLKKYKRQQLLDYARDLELKKCSRLRKDDLIKLIVECFCTEEMLRSRMACLTNEQMSLFRRACDTPQDVSINDVIDGMLLCRFWLGDFEEITDKFCVFEEVAETFKKIDDETFRIDQRKKGWMMKCIQFFIDFYGIAPLEVIYKLYKLKVKDTIDEMIILLDEMPIDILESCVFPMRSIGIQDWPKNDPIYSSKGLLIHISLLEDDELDYLLDCQIGKEFYIPSVQQIEEISRLGYEASAIAYKKLEKFFIKKMHMSYEQAEIWCVRTWANNYDAETPEDVINEMTESGIVIKDERQMEELVDLLIDTYNNTRMKENRGYKPNELANMESRRFARGMPTIVPGSSHAAELLREAEPQLETIGIPIDLDENADTITDMMFSDELSGKPVRVKKKIYPNDPCPCGSGKKYKKCCGK